MDRVWVGYNLKTAASKLLIIRGIYMYVCTIFFLTLYVKSINFEDVIEIFTRNVDGNGPDVIRINIRRKSI